MGALDYIRWIYWICWLLVHLIGCELGGAIAFVGVKRNGSASGPVILFGNVFDIKVTYRVVRIRYW